MESAFRDVLQRAGVTPATIDVLENEMVVTEDIFYSLSETHFQHILPRIKIGQHAILLGMWHENIMSHSTKHFKASDDSLVASAAESYRSKRSSSVGSSVAEYCESTSSNSSNVESKGVGKKLLTSSSDIKDLVQIYKANAVSRFSKGCNPVQNKPEASIKTIKILLGGMIYDSKKEKGVRKRFLPEPNPTAVEFGKDDTLLVVCEKAINLYYAEFNVTVEDVMMCDSSGTIINCDMNQGVYQYYTLNNYVPSRHKLYTAVNLEATKAKVSGDIVYGSQKETKALEIDDSTTKQLTQQPQNFPLVETEPVIKSCVECGRSYRTYVPESSCNLPDGSAVTYNTPQLTCPLCDSMGYGEFMNYDLFPELIDPNKGSN